MSNGLQPNFLGIGGQKCASTWVYRVLKDHPQAGVGDPKELDFFSYFFNHGFQWYESHFSRSIGRPVRGEISPSYFCDAHAAERAARYNPAFRVVLTLRDPVDRAYSNHLHDIRTKNYVGPDLTFEAGLSNNPMYLIQSRYSKYLRKWFDFFSREQILVLLQEEIKIDPARAACELYRFLGIAANHRSAFLFRRANESYVEKIAGLDASLRTLGRIARFVGAAKTANAVRNVPCIVKVREKNRRYLGEIVPPMTDDMRLRLQDAFADDILEVARLLRRDALPWKTWECAVSRERKAASR